MVWDHEVAGSNPVTPTVFQKKPFGANVEGLSHWGDQRCIIEICWLPEVRAFWVHEYAADTRDISNQFAAGGPDFLIYGQNLGRDGGQFSAGLSTQLRDRVRMGLHYDAFVTPNSVAHGGMIQVQLCW